MLLICFAIALDAQLRIGPVTIQGNWITRDSVIRDVVNLFPGQRLLHADLRKAERALRKLDLFKSATIELEHPNRYESFKNVLITVKEATTGRIGFFKETNASGQTVFRLVAEERNLDPFRWPRSANDFEERRVFRGGGVGIGFDVAITVVEKEVDPSTVPRCRLQFRLMLPWLLDWRWPIGDPE